MLPEEQTKAEQWLEAVPSHPASDRAAILIKLYLPKDKSTVSVQAVLGAVKSLFSDSHTKAIPRFPQTMEQLRENLISEDSLLKRKKRKVVGQTTQT